MKESSHVPVLLEEALQALQVKENGIYVDATYGRGGHARQILERIGKLGQLHVFDRDAVACDHARHRFGNDSRVIVHQEPFSMLEQTLNKSGLTGRVHGILFDLGVSSPQLDESKRGFSFQADGPLDMRMDPNSGESAADWIGHAEENEIARVIRDFGEERFAKRIARAIVRERSINPITSTNRLAEIVARAIPVREKRKNPATRTFQAIRIHINGELDELAKVLPQTVHLLASGGRLVVISFHSLEDRMVKRFLHAEAKGAALPPDLPVNRDYFRPKLRIIGKALRARESEARDNPRARSAVLRIAERMDEKPDV